MFLDMVCCSKRASFAFDAEDDMQRYDDDDGDFSLPHKR